MPDLLAVYSTSLAQHSINIQTKHYPVVGSSPASIRQSIQRIILP